MNKTLYQVDIIIKLLEQTNTELIDFSSEIFGEKEIVAVLEKIIDNNKKVIETFNILKEALNEKR